MKEERTYIISIVFSAGLYDGRECIPIVGTDPQAVIAEAYSVYKEECFDMENEQIGYEEFCSTMEAGFNGKSDIALIQRNDEHIQFEGTSDIDIHAAEEIQDQTDEEFDV